MRLLNSFIHNIHNVSLIQLVSYKHNHRDIYHLVFTFCHICQIFYKIGLIPILHLLGVSATVKASFSGAMIVLADLMLLLGAAVAGKEGFAFIKARVFGIVRSYGPPRKVSRTRYTIGLMMFAAPMIFG